MDSPTLKVHVRSDNMATITCPACGITKHISAEKLLQVRHAIAIRCRCQHTFKVFFDFRRYYRKPTNLPGIYVIIKPAGGGGGIAHINNISRSGLSLTVSGLHHIKGGYELTVDFQLNDHKKTMLKKQVVVKSVQENSIGCQFKGINELDPALGFYLQT